MNAPLPAAMLITCFCEISQTVLYRSLMCCGMAAQFCQIINNIYTKINVLMSGSSIFSYIRSIIHLYVHASSANLTYSAIHLNQALLI